MGSEKFEVSLDKLEKIVEALESGELSLEDSLKKYEEGVKLAAQCSCVLNQAEKKIEVLSQSATGEFKTEDFDGEKDEEPKKKRAARKTSEDDTGLFS